MNLCARRGGYVCCRVGGGGGQMRDSRWEPSGYETISLWRLRTLQCLNNSTLNRRTMQCNYSSAGPYEGELY